MPLGLEKVHYLEDMALEKVHYLDDMALEKVHYLEDMALEKVHYLDSLGDCSSLELTRRHLFYNRSPHGMWMLVSKSPCNFATQF